MKQKEKIEKLLSKVDEKLLLINGIRTIYILRESNFKPSVCINYLKSENFERITEEELILKLEEILKIKEEKLKRILKNK